ncbi:MAG: hypothetical protein GYB64_08185 [Chloroflexi bacterium]|nr:hypothetical protein [Chloroflexota bacterium]
MQTSGAERFGYGSYFAGQNISYSLIQGYLLVFYVNRVGLNPALVATIFLVVRIWDAVNDPLIGLIMDRTRFANSRYKGWLNLTAFLMPLATFILFLTPLDAPFAVTLTYIVVTYLLWDVLYTMSEVPIFSVSTSMTTIERERTILLTLTQIGSVLGVALAQGMITFLLPEEGVDSINWVLFAGLPALGALVTMIPQIFTVQERHHTDVVEDVSLGEMIQEVLRNDQHLKIMSLYLSQAFFNAVGVFALFVAEGYYGDARLASITSVFSLIGILGLGILTPAIVARFGKKPYLEASMIATIVLSLPLFFIPGSSPLLAMIFFGTRTATLVVTSLLRPMFTADCIEYGEHKTGVRNDSTAFAIQTFFNKTGDAIGTALGGYLLAFAGYNEALTLAEQSAGTINTLQLLFIVLPMLMALVMWLGSRFLYNLDEKTVKGYIAENAAREPTPAGD